MYISTVVVRGIVAELENRDLSAERVLRAAALERSQLLDPSCGIRYREFDRLVRQALDLSRDPMLGLKVGCHAPETMLHVLGLLLLSTPTLRAAFGELERYSALIAAGQSWQLCEEGAIARLSYGWKPTEDADPRTQRFMVECQLALALRVGRRFARSEPPHEVWLQHPEPASSIAYRELFRCPVRFAQRENAIVFRRTLLDRSQLFADANVNATLKVLADEQLDRFNGTSSFASRVRSVLRFETDLTKVDLQSLATRWGISRRALRRRLSNEGESLTELLDEARCERAVRELRRPDCKLKHVAEDLGYSETSAFHRAFKRWTGRTPTDFRADLRAAPARPQSAEGGL